jgi:hypothetical protein
MKLSHVWKEGLDAGWITTEWTVLQHNKSHDNVHTACSPSKPKQISDRSFQNLPLERKIWFLWCAIEIMTEEEGAYLLALVGLSPLVLLSSRIRGRGMY